MQILPARPAQGWLGTESDNAESKAKQSQAKYVDSNFS